MPTKNKKKYTKKELESFKSMILAKKTKLVEELGLLETTSLFGNSSRENTDLSGLSNHMADSASDFNTLETNFELAEREGKYLVYLEDALERIEAGTYGICKNCESLIPKLRLEHVPTATRCVECKQEVKVKEAEAIERAKAKAALAAQARVR